MILIDSNVLIDIFIGDAVWRDWSSQALAEATQQETAIHDVVYAEVVSIFAAPDMLDAALASLGIGHRAMTRQSLFLAGSAFKACRRAGGPRTSLLPDLFIGAQAKADSLTVLTRDPRWYRQYFPDVKLITP